MIRFKADKMLTVLCLFIADLMVVGCGGSGGLAVDGGPADASFASAGQNGSSSSSGGMAGTAGTLSSAGRTATGGTANGGVGGTGSESRGGGATQSSAMAGHGGSGGSDGGETQDSASTGSGGQGNDAGVSEVGQGETGGNQPDANPADLQTAFDLKPLDCILECTLNCPYGYVLDNYGCPTCACAPNPSLGCNQLLAAGVCDSSPKCRWLTPGCAFSGTILPAAGCYDKSTIDCQSSQDCPDGKSCVSRIINPCADGSCGSCGSAINLCL